MLAAACGSFEAAPSSEPGATDDAGPPTMTKRADAGADAAATNTETCTVLVDEPLSARDLPGWTKHETVTPNIAILDIMGLANAPSPIKVLGAETVTQPSGAAREAYVDRTIEQAVDTARIEYDFACRMRSLGARSACAPTVPRRASRSSRPMAGSSPPARS